MKFAVALVLALSAAGASALDVNDLVIDKPLNCSMFDFAKEAATACSRELEFTTTIDFLDRETPALISRNRQGILKSIALTSFNPEKAYMLLSFKFGEPYTINSYESVWVKNDLSIRFVNYVGMGPLLVFSGKAAEKD